MPSQTFTFAPGHWLRGHIREMQRDPLALYSELQQTHGDYVRMRVVRGIDCYVLTHPDAVERVLHGNHRNYRKPDIFYKSVSLLVGDGLFTNEGESWTNQRKFVQPAFHPGALSKLCPKIVDSAEQFATQRFEEPIDIARAMMKLGLRIASTTLFSADISGEADIVGRGFRVAFKHVSNQMNSMHLVPSWMPTPNNLRFWSAKRELDRVVTGIIAKRRELTDTEQPHDLLANMLRARDVKTGEPMPEQMLMDEVLTLLTAGHENIGAALAWTWYLLAKHPEVQEQLFDEISGELRGKAAAFEDVAKLPLLRAVFEESMRLYPPGWGELRESINEDQIAGRSLPAKAMIIHCQWVTHRHRDFWEEPEAFRPERFMGETARQRHRFAYFPFGGGPRICIGMQLAMMEGTLVIATILRRYRVQLIEGQPVVADATFTLQPKSGVWVRMVRRGS